MDTISENLTILNKDQKQVVAKSLMDLNYSATEISRLLDIDRTTVYRYSKEPTPEDLQQFATEFKTSLMMKQHLILAKIIRRIDQLVDRTFDLKGLLKAYEIIKPHTQSLYDIHKNAEYEKKRKLYNV
jgi:predicted transcriptional regulator